MIYVTPKKLHAKKEEKLLKRFWDRPSILTDGQTDGRTTDKSVLEKLHCLSAGGANKKLTTGVKCKRAKFGPVIMTFRAIQPNPSYDMLLMSSQRSFMPKKRKSYWSISKICPPPPPPLNLDGRTDRRRTDNSALEKLCCLSAGRAKKGTILTFNL